MSRRRWVYTEGGQPLAEPYEISADVTPGAETRAPVVTEELVYGNVGNVATGVNIDTRAKFNRYMKEAGVAHSSDYSKEHYEKKQAERARAFTPGSGYDTKRRQEKIHVALQKLQAQGKLKRK